jgi:hypothetical protein
MSRYLQYPDYKSEFERVAIREAVLEETAKCLTIASKYSGYVIGNFVKDVIIPRKEDPNCDVQIDNLVGIWFANTDNYTHFINEMGPSLVGTEFPKTFRLIKYDTVIAKIKVIVSETCPCIHYDIQGLTVMYENNQPKTLMKLPCDKINNLTVEDILNNIRTKRATVVKIDASQDEINKTIYQYSCKGWTVISKGIEIPPYTNLL